MARMLVLLVVFFLGEGTKLEDVGRFIPSSDGSINIGTHGMTNVKFTENKLGWLNLKQNDRLIRKKFVSLASSSHISAPLCD